MKLEIKQLSKHYGDHKALKQFNITLQPGVYGLLGPNGAGKSTLMKLICMLLEPTEGEILLSGEDIHKNRKEFLRKLGYMPQQMCLYPEFRVDEYLYYIGALKGIDKNVVKEQSEVLLREVRLESVRHQRIRTLSGGMQQRLMFAQALLGDPNIVILDEPTAGLDPQKRIEMRNMISEYSKDKIILIATHVVSDVELISDQILLLKKGELIAKDSAQGLTQNIYGSVYEIEVKDSLQLLKEKYRVSSMYHRNGNIYAKILLKNGETQPDGACIVYPDLEDVYLYYFDKE